MLPEARDWTTLLREFRWRIPQRFNIAESCCDRHARRADGVALIAVDEAGAVREWRFSELQRRANRLANLLAASGIGHGDRIAVLLDQHVDTLVTHLAAFKLGAVSVPLFRLFGPDALEFRLADCGAAAVVSDRAGLERVAAIAAPLPELRHRFAVEDIDALLKQSSDRFETADTAADDPAVIIYTSGTTGQPKGALHAHRVLLGHLPGVQLPQRLFPQPGDRFWTPADWAWIGGLLDVLLPSLHFGVPVVATRLGKFDPERAFDVIARHGVRNVFMPATALRMMQASGISGLDRGCALRSIGSGGERLGDGLLEWGRSCLGVTINEFYGQTECNLVVSDCDLLFPHRANAIGRAVPGHQVAILDDDGEPLAPGTLGRIAVRRPDPVMFLGYWGRPEATADKFHGDWLVTGDQGVMDEEGYVTFAARDDDVITTAGYRVGPGEIEEVLNSHPAVAMSAVVGVPDPLRGEAIRAHIVLAPGHEPGKALARELQARVKERLAAHEYPREVIFVAELPMTATGKIRRAALRASAAGPTGQPGGSIT